MFVYCVRCWGFRNEFRIQSAVPLPLTLSGGQASSLGRKRCLLSIYFVPGILTFSASLQGRHYDF